MNSLSPEEERAAKFAQEVLNADPAIGPVEVRYISAQQDVRDERFLILLFGGERAFLFDRKKGSTATIPLEVGKSEGDKVEGDKVEGDARRDALIAAAKAAATKEKLSVIYFVQH
jgi:hypothetical protein